MFYFECKIVLIHLIPTYYLQFFFTIIYLDQLLYPLGESKKEKKKIKNTYYQYLVGFIIQNNKIRSA